MALKVQQGGKTFTVEGVATLVEEPGEPNPQPQDCVQSATRSEAPSGPIVNGKQEWTITIRRVTTIPASNGGVACLPEFEQFKEMRDVANVPGHREVTIESPGKGHVFAVDGLLPVKFTVDKPWVGEARLFAFGVIVDRLRSEVIDGGQTLMMNTRLLREMACIIHVEIEQDNGATSRSVGHALMRRPDMPTQPKPPECQGQTGSMYQYLYFTKPDQQIRGHSYERSEKLHVKLDGPTNSIELRCQWTGGGPAAISKRARLLIDNGTPVTPWTASQSVSASEVCWKFNYDATQNGGRGNHAMFAEIERIGTEPGLYCQGFQFATGAPLVGPQDVWVCPQIFDIWHRNTGTSMRPIRVHYPGTMPQHRGRHLPIPGRKAVPWTHSIKPADIYAEPRAVISVVGWPRRFVQTKDGHICTLGIQQYHYYDQQSKAMPLYDGALEHGAYGHIWDAQLDSDGGVWWIAVNGRVGYTHIAGRISTIFGDRKPLDRPAVFPDEVESIGIFLDPEKKAFVELWSLCLVTGLPAGTAPQLLAVDSYAHCLYLIDTANSRTKGGQATARVIAGSKDGTAGYADGAGVNARFDAPWVIRPDRFKPGIYMLTEFNGARLRKIDARAGFDNLVVSTEFESATPNPHVIGRPREMMHWKPPARPIHKGGAKGVGTLHWPQGLAQDSKGNWLIGCKYDRGTQWLVEPKAAVLNPDGSIKTPAVIGVETKPYGSLVRYNPVTKTVSDSLFSPGENANAHDWVLACNWDGTCGVLDTVYFSRWGEAMRLEPDGEKYKSTGLVFYTENSGWYKTALNEGVAEATQHPSYPATVDCLNGRVFMQGIGTEGGYMYTQKLASDPVYTNAINDRLARAKTIYTQNFGLALGIYGNDTLKGMSFRDWAQFSDTDLQHAIRCGMGLGYSPGLNDTQISDLIAYIRHPFVAAA